MYASPAFQRLTGYALAELRQLTLADLIADTEERQPRSVDTDAPSPYRELFFRNKQGQRILIKSHRLALPPDKGARTSWLLVEPVDAQAEFPANDSLPAVGQTPATMVVVGRTDIREHKSVEDKVKLSANVFIHAREGILITDEHGVITDANLAFCEMTGFQLEEMVGKNPRIFKSGQQNDDFYREMWTTVKDRGSWSGELWNRAKNGDLYAALVKISSVPSERQQGCHYLALYTDITKHKEYERQLEYIAHYDALTQLPNRVLLADRLSHGIDQAHRRGNILAVVYLDLDGFKNINDSHGHDAGDFVLTNLAKRMKYALRRGDTLARIGGDEFVALLVDLPDADSATPLLDRLLAAASRPVHFGERYFQVSASLGVTFYPQNQTQEADQLLRQADQAMYYAKLTGKNRYHVFDIEQEQTIQLQQRLHDQLYKALRNHELLLHYHPLVDMHNGTTRSVEALLRWQHPEKGLLQAEQFLPQIKNHQLVIALGQWVIGETLHQMREWRGQGLEIAISINIGGDRKQSVSLAECLDSALPEYPDIDPSLLALEIQEPRAQEANDYNPILNICHKWGLSITIDNFGMDNLPLKYLTRFPTHTIKFDKCFLADLVSADGRHPLLASVVDILRLFGCQAVVAGIENEEQHARLLELGYDLGQGYYFASPMPAEELTAWLRHRHDWATFDTTERNPAQ